MPYGGGGGRNVIAVHRNCPRPRKNAKWGHFLCILVLIYKYPDNVLNRTEQSRRKQWGRPSASFSDIFAAVLHIMKMSEMRKISLLAGALNTLNL